LTDTGSIGNLASAATVAASSFDMKATDPTFLIEKVDLDRWSQLRRRKAIDDAPNGDIIYVKPAGESVEVSEAPSPEIGVQDTSTKSEKFYGPKILGEVEKLGDMIDTDAVSHMHLF
jgi:hypothetical protein